MENLKFINGEALLQTFKIKNISSFPYYLKSVWKDLSRRSDSSEIGFDSNVFSHYYDIPIIISNRLFTLFDKDSDGYLSYKEFSKGMNLLFNSSIYDLMEFIFSLFDQNNDDLVSYEDIRTIFQYIPLQKSFSESSFKDRLESQEEIHLLISSLFNEQEQINYRVFKKYTIEENSTIFLYVSVYLLSSKPFSERTLNFFQSETELKEDMKKSPNHKPIQKEVLIASPNLTSKFSPSVSILHSPIMKEQKESLTQVLKKISNTNNLHRQSTYNKESKNILNKETELVEENKEEIDLLIPIRNTNNNINIENYLSILERTNEASLKDPDELLNAINNYEEKEKNNISYEGSLLKLVDDKLKKLWFALNEKYLYCKLFIFITIYIDYKHKSDSIHKGMHTLTDCYIKPCGQVNLFGNLLFRFEIYFPNKVREYYVVNEIEYNNWIEKLKESTGQTDISLKYEVVDNLKSGKYGIIKEVKNIFTDESCCLKIINKQKMNSKESQELKTEVEIMKICQHPNIVKLYDIYENHDNKFIVMEYCKEGDLFTYLQSRNFKLSEKDVVKIIKQILSGLFYLHQYGITHRDLKPENILVSSKNGKVLFKITDFGLSKIISPNEFCEEPYGTLCYCAPEVISHKPYNKKADLWSIGIITYLMLIGCLPFNSNSNEKEIIHQILNEPTPYPMQQWKKVSFKAKTYVMGLLQKDPNKRMSIKEALENEWLLLGVNKEDEKIVKFKTKSYFGEYCKVDDM